MDGCWETSPTYDCKELAVAEMQCYHRFSMKKVDGFSKKMCRFHVPKAQSGNYHFKWEVVEYMGAYYEPPTQEECFKWLKSYEK